MCSKVMDFLTDDDFINYVLGVTPQSASQWETYFREHPEETVSYTHLTLPTNSRV